MNVGSPHLAIPILQAVAKKTGAEVFVKDLNWEISKHFKVKPALSDLYSAVECGDLDSLNRPYFRAEDKLMAIAQKYQATWNVQLGFKYEKYRPESAKEVMEATAKPSPFKQYYENYVLPYIKEVGPHVIGFSIASPGQLIPAFQLCYSLRKSGYNNLILMGGNIISRLRDTVNNPELYKLVDIFVFYQGELPLTGVINKSKKRDTNFHNIPNLSFCDDGQVVITPILEKFDLQALPTPDFEGFPLGEYWGVNYVTLVAARGCYHGNCHFCAIPLGWNPKGFAGVRKANLVFNDMCNIYTKYGFAKFKFVDESMIPNLIGKIARKIKDTGFPFEWEGYARLEEKWMDEDFVRTVAEGGLKKCYFGLEVYPTGNRKALNKQDFPQPEKLLHICQKYGVKVHFFCIVGFPGIGKQEAETTIDFILRNANLIDTVDIYRFGYMRHTQVPKVKPIMDPEKDWTMEYNWVPNGKGVLTKDEAEALKVELEEILWHEHPKMLHPTYRLLSPWG